MKSISNAAVRPLALRLRPGDDLRAALESFARRKLLRAACIATCVGSVSRAAIRFADRPEAQTLEGPFEIVSLVGTLSPDGAHLHVSLSDGAGRTIGGHLARGTPVHTTAEIVLIELPGLRFSRRHDPSTAFRELVVRSLRRKC